MKVAFTILHVAYTIKCFNEIEKDLVCLASVVYVQHMVMRHLAYLCDR